jgi:hypothetical protein
MRSILKVYKLGINHYWITLESILPLDLFHYYSVGIFKLNRYAFVRVFPKIDLFYTFYFLQLLCFIYILYYYYVEFKVFNFVYNNIYKFLTSRIIHQPTDPINMIYWASGVT